MAHQEVLAKEIEELEKVVFGNPRSLEESTDSAEPKDSSTETVNETETIETREEIPNDTFDLASSTKSTESTEDVITQEELELDQTEGPTKPTRINWKKKFKELDKRFRNLKASNDSTIFSLRTELSKAQKDQKDLYTKVDELTSKLAEAELSKGDNFDDLLSTDEKDIVGPETLEAVKKLSKASIDAQVKPLKEQLEREKQKRLEDLEALAEVNDNQAKMSFLNRLGDIVPDYAELDTNPEFLSWMDLTDELSGSQRKQLFKQAHSYGDVGRVAQFFLDFKKMKDIGKEELEQKVTPRSSSSSSTNSITKPKSTKYVSLQKIQQFQEEVNKGRFKGRETLQRQIEQEIDNAQRDGRIVP